MDFARKRSEEDARQSRRKGCPRASRFAYSNLDCLACTAVCGRPTGIRRMLTGQVRLCATMSQRSRGHDQSTGECRTRTRVRTANRASHRTPVTPARAVSVALAGEVCSLHELDMRPPALYKVSPLGNGPLPRQLHRIHTTQTPCWAGRVDGAGHRRGNFRGSEARLSQRDDNERPPLPCGRRAGPAGGQPDHAQVHAERGAAPLAPRHAWRVQLVATRSPTLATCRTWARWHRRRWRQRR